MSDGGLGHLGQLHALAEASCEPAAWATWFVKFSSNLLGQGPLVLFFLVLALVGVSSLVVVSPRLRAYVLRLRHRQRNPYDFLLEFFSQGLLHPRLSAAGK